MFIGTAAFPGGNVRADEMTGIEDSDTASPGDPSEQAVENQYILDVTETADAEDEANSKWLSEYEYEIEENYVHLPYFNNSDILESDVTLLCKGYINNKNNWYAATDGYYDKTFTGIAQYEGKSGWDLRKKVLMTQPLRDLLKRPTESGITVLTESLILSSAARLLTAPTETGTM